MAKTAKKAARRTAKKTNARSSGKATKKSARTAAKKSPRKAGKKAAKKAARAPAAPALRTLTPYLALRDAAAAIAWYKKVFGAKEIDRMPAPGGKLMHAQLRVGDSDLFLSDVFPGSDTQEPTALRGTSVTLHLWSRHVDKWWSAAVEGGAKVTMPLDDMFWGDRYGKIVDPFGHVWAISWKSKLPKAELERRREATMAQFAAGGPS